ncbi:MAG: hypothetical protein IJS01_00865 [Lentisphaeria bacterium]|nr:hypothetical protein [Lentisphaeria bacterium]
MKKTLLLASIFSVLASGALDLAVKPLRTNGLKQVVIKDSTVRGVVVPGGSVDLPLPAKTVDTSKFTRAVLTIAPAEGGYLPGADDLRLNLRSAADKKVQLESYGTPGEKEGEVFFRLADAPADTSIARLYVDETRRCNGKTMAMKIVSVRFDDGPTDLCLPVFYARLNNCDQPVKAGRTFSGIPKNTGAAVILAMPVGFKPGTFQKVEMKLTVEEGTLPPEALEFNPRSKGVSASAYVSEPASEKYVFNFKKPVVDPTSVFFYFNRKGTSTGKPVKFRIDAIRLLN